ncbi:MAG: hypothetical protein ACI4WS_10290 [Oscillospiraceae bacterium]
MTDNSHKISAPQLFCILLLIRVSAELVYPSESGFGGTGLAAALTAEVLRFLIALPVLVYSFRGREFYAAIWRKHRFWGWVSAAGAALLLAGAAVRTLIYGAEFVQRTMLNRTSGLLIAALLAGFGAYAALKGCEALARAGVLFLAAAGAVTLLAIAADIPEMHRIRDLPDWSVGLFVGDVIERFLRGGEYLVFAALLPYVRTDGRNRAETRSGAAGMLFAVASAVIAAGLCVFYGAVLGEYSTMTDYPIAAASSLADIVLFKRLDGAVCALWALGAALRVGVMAFSAFAIIRELTRNNVRINRD